MVKLSRILWAKSSHYFAQTILVFLDDWSVLFGRAISPGIRHR
jgi:hypothetical protein